MEAFWEKAHSGFKYLIVGIIILFVIAMSLTFMVKAWIVLCWL